MEELLNEIEAGTHDGIVEAGFAREIAKRAYQAGIQAGKNMATDVFIKRMGFDIASEIIEEARQ